MYQPLEQFEIKVFEPFFFKFINFFLQDNFLFLTNSLLYSGFTIFSVYFFLIYPIKNKSILPKNGFEFLSEALYIGLFTIFIEQIGEDIEADYIFPFLFSTFIFILFSNILGLTPYGFTTTSFIVKTFMLGFSFLVSLTLVGFVWLRGHFFDMFVPKGVPKALVPLLVVIEVVSYVSRGFSLSIRLFANMMSGHSLLNILSSFCVSLTKKSLLFGLIPFIIVFAITFLEVGIAFLQAYVFVVLLCIYLNDALNGHGEEEPKHWPEDLENSEERNLYPNESISNESLDNVSTENMIFSKKESGLLTISKPEYNFYSLKFKNFELYKNYITKN